MNMICPRCWGSKNEPGIGLAICSYCKGTGTTEDYFLSPHFKLSELLYSQTAVRKGIANESSDLFVSRLTEVCTDLLEPLRTQFGPLHVDSGFRSIELNHALSGASATSVHSLGWAVDFIPLKSDVRLKTIIDWILASTLAFDQVIYEGTWIHLGRFSPSNKVRKMPLMAFPSAGRMQYSIYVPSDPRVI